MCKFLSTSRFKCIGYKEFDLKKYTSNILKGCAPDVDLKYPKELLVNLKKFVLNFLIKESMCSICALFETRTKI